MSTFTPIAPADDARLATLARSLAALVRSGTASIEFAVAVANGERDVNRLTNMVFFARHPERNGALIRRDETTLAREWLSIRDTIVLPTLRGPATTPQPTSPSRQEPIPEPAQLEEFMSKLSADWSQARKRAGLSAVSPEAMKSWLQQDYRDTVEGARLRWAKPGRAAPDITRAWMIGRGEHLRFQTAAAKLPGMARFAPPANRGEQLVSARIIDGSNVAPTASSTVRFVEALKSRNSDIRVSTYRGHGGGSWKDRGYSLDLFFSTMDTRGFYPSDQALRFFRDLAATAASTNHEWRALYNDFAIADEVNRSEGKRRVVFVGSARRDGPRVLGLNWHGPSPLILHIHLDIAPR